jgi:hypothetical protein
MRSRQLSVWRKTYGCGVRSNHYLVMWGGRKLEPPCWSGTPKLGPPKELRVKRRHDSAIEYQSQRIILWELQLFGSGFEIGSVESFVEVA